MKFIDNSKKLLERFWRDSEKNNFSAPAIVLYSYLIFLYQKQQAQEIFLHPQKLSILVRGFSLKDMTLAEEELLAAGYIKLRRADKEHSSTQYTLQIFDGASKQKI